MEFKLKDKNFISFLLIVVIIQITNNSIKAQSDSCISWKDLEEAYKEKQKTTDPNMTEVPKTADQLMVDKEKIKRLPSLDGNPVSISITFFIDDLNSISDVNMDYRIDFYLLQEWTAYKDDCTIYKNSLIGRNMSLENITQSNKLFINEEYFTLFWLPDIIVSNAKEVHQQSELIKTILLQMYFEDETQEDCKMQFLARSYSIVSCPMDFHDAPIDSQICNLKLRSFSFNDRKITLFWTERVTSNPEIKLLEHVLTIGQSNSTSEVFNETFSTLKIILEFDRKIANKMVGVYTPSILIVVITFCSFWLGLNSTSERVTIGITALLALVTQFNDVRQSLPPTSYITEIDKWMIMCMVFVSGQMIQCTVVDFVYHHQKHKHRMRERAMNVIKRFRRLSQQKQTLMVPDIKFQDHKQPDKLNAFNGNNSYAKLISNIRLKVPKTVSKEKKVENKSECNCFSQICKSLSSLISVPMSSDKPEYLPMKIDAVSRIIFPLFFVTICMFYWPTMLMKTF